MKTIRELAGIVEPNRSEILQQFKSLDKPDNQLGYLYQKGKQLKDPDMEELAETLFPGKQHAGKYLNHLKHRLTNKLLDLTLLADFGKNEVQRAYFYSYRRFTVAKMLIGIGAKSIGIRVAERAFARASKYEFTEICFFLANELMLHYGAILGDQKLFQKFKKLADYYMMVLQAEYLAQKYYAEVVFYFSNSRNTKSEYAEISTEYAEELKKLRKKVTTYKFNLLYFNILASRFQFLNDYKQLITTCEEAIQHFEAQSRPLPYTVFFSFYIKKASSHINLKQFQEADEDLGKCQELPSSGSYNWHVMMIYQALLGFHAREYTMTFQAFEKAKTQMDNVPENIAQQWRIVEAYIYFFQQRIPTERKGRFKLGKFLNDVPIYSKDKRGNNISILILQILIFLSQGKKSAIIDRVDALKQYTRRYLNTGNTFRSSCFIKMLTQLESGNFNRIAVSRKAETYYKQLQSVPIDVAQQPGELEVVPYEVLWDMVLEMLD
ncbi:MAG: hypothetical protein DHS20C18_25050 [Saprospiraceae bacterium]|nr:MAG: hypothetical protein DHS20C18_25050 [Saprospiraceae bacterium]